MLTSLLTLTLAGTGVGNLRMRNANLRMGIL